jgi:hypothetical protein
VKSHIAPDHFADVGKMVDLGSRRVTEIACRNLNNAVEFAPSTPYTLSHIRPLAVRPLDHPERWPTPWGFLFSGADCARGWSQ